MVPAGLMPDENDATVVLEGDASDAIAAGITIEPDGGSPEPTTPPIAVFELTA
jgi:anti-sigma-K factor RskA